MVFFTCNDCNESLKLNKVESHKFRCNFSIVTCVDCLKDFDNSTFKSHKICMTEDQRYGGKDYQAKPQKGLIKQQNWIEKLQELIDKSNFERETMNYLNRILNYDNIPRKKPKFINFIKSSIVRDEKIAEKLWLIIESAIKPTNTINKSINEKQEIKNEKQEIKNDKQEIKNDKQEIKNDKQEENNDKELNNNDNELKNEKSIDNELNKDLKRKLNDDELENLENKKIKMIESQECNQNLMSKDQLIEKAIDKLIERSKETNTFINPIKLTKKILKHQENKEMKLKKFKKLIRRVRSNTEFNELDLIEYYDKFIDKLNMKDCFIIDKEMIVYK